MPTGPVEIYVPRTVTDLGQTRSAGITWKRYGLTADAQAITEDMLRLTDQVLANEVPLRVANMGNSNRVGFVITHPGTAGITIAAQWWAEGSVLCQHIYRRAYDAAAPLDTITRPAVACVWELEVIAAEQDAWRRFMMCQPQDLAAYLAFRADKTPA